MQIKWTASVDLSDIHLRFLDLVNLLLLHLSSVDNLELNLTEEFTKLKASDFHDVYLFDESVLSKLHQLNSFFQLKILLLPFITWLNHSILRQLVLASKNPEALKVLNQFDSLIDYTKPITSYPIPAPSQLMIPLTDSSYTIVATKYGSNLQKATLQDIVNINDVLRKQWDITVHTIQLIAVHYEHGWLYWMVPKCILPIIEDKIPHIQNELWKSQITMISMFPKELFSDKSDNSLIDSSPFSLLATKV